MFVPSRLVFLLGGVLGNFLVAFWDIWWRFCQKGGDLLGARLMFVPSHLAPNHSSHESRRSEKKSKSDL